MTKIAKLDGVKFFACAVALASLAACGGGGSDGVAVGGGDKGGNGAGAETTVTGTVAKGAIVAGAAVQLNCANGASLNVATRADGTYSVAGIVAYPCIGIATLGKLQYRGMLFASNVANFTPLTDMLAEATLAAAAAGAKSLAMADFQARVKADVTFAQNVSAAAPSYRSAVLDTVKAKLILAGKTETEANAILAAARAAAFDATPFVLGSDLDKVLDASAAYLQDANGNVLPEMITAVKAAADTLPTPAASATGATGGSGNS